MGYFERRATQKWENRPQPFGLRRKSGHTSLSSLTVDPATAFGFRLVWPDFRPQRHRAKVNNRL